MKNDRTFSPCSPESIYNNGFTIEITRRTYIYFSWLLRKQAAYKHATRGPTALSPFEGLGNEDKVPFPKGTPAAAGRFESGLHVRASVVISTEPQQLL